MKKDLEIQGLTAGSQFIDVARAVILDRLDNMLLHEPGVREGVDIESLHDMRVYSRRLREALKIFSMCYRKKDFKDIASRVRDVTKALGEVRNLDVFIAYFKQFNETEDPDPARAAAADSLISWAGERRHGLRETMIQDLDSLDTESLAEDIRTMVQNPKCEDPHALMQRFAAQGLPVVQPGGPGAGIENAELVTVRPGDAGFAESVTHELLRRGCIKQKEFKEYRDLARKILETPPGDNLPLLCADPVSDHARKLIHERLDAVAALWNQALASRDAPEMDILHALRICFKKIRYGLEVLYSAFDQEKRDAVYERIKNFQDILGDLHDAEVFYGLSCDKMKQAVKKDHSESAIGYALLANKLRIRRDDLIKTFYQTVDEYSLQSFQQDINDSLVSEMSA